MVCMVERRNIVNIKIMKIDNVFFILCTQNSLTYNLLKIICKLLCILCYLRKIEYIILNEKNY